MEHYEMFYGAITVVSFITVHPTYRQLRLQQSAMQLPGDQRFKES
jgi:hypothetical protein